MMRPYRVRLVPDVEVGAVTVDVYAESEEEALEAAVKTARQMTGEDMLAVAAYEIAGGKSDDG